MAKVKKPKAVGAEDLGIEIHSSIDAEFRNADDRVMAVVGAAYLDSILGQLLRAAFLDDEEEVNRLLAPDRPLGANGSRYQLAYCLGLITADQRDDLKTIAKIRNLFAHNYSVASFESDQSKAILKNLHFAERQESIRKCLISREPKVGVKKAMEASIPKQRMIFRDAVFELFVVLLPKIRDVRRAELSLWFGKGSDVGA
jgi:DNA-binding MltR family transcriptional regulator